MKSIATTVATAIATTVPGLLLATLALPAAYAQTSPPKLVTRDELRVCMNLETDVLARRQALAARSQQNKDEAAAIRAEQQELAAEQKKLEEDDKPMDRFNRKIKVHNARVQAVQAGAAVLNTELDSVNKALLAYNGQCGGITFLPDDKEAILKERAAAKN